MDEPEKAKLTKQKKLVDCIDYMNTALEAFERLEEYKTKVLPILDGFDLEHSDTYLELTNHMKRELFYIKFFTNRAALMLVEYRRLCHPKQDIYSVKEKKNEQKYGIKPVGDWKKRHEEIQRLLDSNQEQLNKMLAKTKPQQQELVDSSSEELKSRLQRVDEIKRKEQVSLTKRIEQIELGVLRLQWAMLLLFVLQIAILIRLLRF